MTNANTELDIAPLESDTDAETCARMMAATDPWITLQRGYDKCLRIIRNPEAEVLVGKVGGEVVGVAVLIMKGALVGYVQVLCVAPEWQSRGIGAQILTRAEERVFRDSPNVFLCVSSFNPRAKAMYERQGYRQVGEIPEYVVAGHSEFLMRKTIGPLSGFVKK